MEDEKPTVDKADLAAVSDILQFVEKVLHSYRIYAADHGMVKQFEEKLFEKISAFLASSDELSLAVKPFEYIFMGEAAYRNTDKEGNFSFRFHQDGLRQLSFNKGLTKAELGKFLSILRTDFTTYEYYDEDTVTLLWKSEFEHISYVVVESFMSKGEDEEEIEVVLSRMMNALMKDESLPSLTPLLSKSGPMSRRLRRSDADEIMSLPDLKNDFFQAVAGNSFSAEEISRDEEVTASRMLLVLLKVLLGAEAESEFQPVALVVKRMAESLLRGGQLGMAAKLYAKIGELSDPTRNPTKNNANLMKHFYDELSNQQFVNRAKEAVLNPDFNKVNELSAFASALAPPLTMLVFDWFKAASKPALREAMIPRLAQGAETHLQEFGGVLLSSDVSLVTSSLTLLEKVGIEKSAPIAKRAFRHADAQVRSKVLDLFSKLSPIHQSSLCDLALKDAHRVVRLKALHWIADSKERKMAKALVALIDEKSFDVFDLDEKRQFYIGLAKLAGDQILPFLKEKLLGSFLDRSEKSAERRACAVAALRQIGGDEAREMVETEHKKERLPDIVRNACDAALKSWPVEGKRGS